VTLRHSGKRATYETLRVCTCISHEKSCDLWSPDEHRQRQQHTEAAGKTFVDKSLCHFPLLSIFKCSNMTVTKKIEKEVDWDRPYALVNSNLLVNQALTDCLQNISSNITHLLGIINVNIRRAPLNLQKHK
jgi:hypothetical protein